MSLTVSDIRFILDKIGREVVVKSTGFFGFDIVSPQSYGYSKDPEISKLQSKLSIMLQVASEKEGKEGCCTFPDTCSKCMPPKD